MKGIRRFYDLPIQGKRVLIREDLNVPLDKKRRITSDARIKPVLPTLSYALQQGAAVMIMAHLGRPIEGQWREEDSLQPIADYLTKKLDQKVKLCRHYLDGLEIESGECVLLENVRLNPGEKKNDETLARQLASLCDIFVMDAFGVAHRAQASTHGVARFAPIACAGPLLEEEINRLDSILYQPEKPMLAIVGGSKVSTKLGVLSRLLDKVDHLIVGGGIANTLLAATGQCIGQSLAERDLFDIALELMQQAKDKGVNIPLPVDVVAAEKFAPDAPMRVIPVEEIRECEMILDIGPKTAEMYRSIIMQMKTIMWNGPLGVFEYPAFSAGTRAIAEAIAASSAYSFAGGGDTLSAIELFSVGEQISSISTGGGSMLEYIEGKSLPGIEILQQRYQN